MANLRLLGMWEGHQEQPPNINGFKVQQSIRVRHQVSGDLNRGRFKEYPSLTWFQVYTASLVNVVQLHQQVSIHLCKTV
jgi:hypothetical protein